MSTRTREQVATAPNVNVNFGLNRRPTTQATATAQPEAAVPFGNANAQAQETPVARMNELLPSDMARTSSLVAVSNVQRCSPTCWFEPLGYCSNGFNINGWCAFHARSFFNVQTAPQEEYINDGTKLRLVRYNRQLVNTPMPLSPTIVRVFPVVELYQNLNELETSLNFGMLAYMLATTIRRKAGNNNNNNNNNNVVDDQRLQTEVDRIVAEHKAYFVLMMETMIAPEYKRAACAHDPIVLINTNDCVNYVSACLEKKEFQLNLLVPNATTNQLQYLDVKRCTTLTQSIVTMFELPYAFARDINMCLAIPASFNVMNGADIVCDQSKMTHGTYMRGGQQTYGSPCTMGMFRSDTGGELTFVTQQFQTSREKCLSGGVDKKRLLERTTFQPFQQQQQQQQQART